MNGPLVDALLPPAILAILALILLLLLRRRAAIAVLIALLLLATEGVPHLLIIPLLLPPAAPPDPAPAAIVVLAGALPDLLDSADVGPDPDTLNRLRTAAALSRATGTPILVTAARASDSPVPLAERMARSLDADFTVRATWAETRSTNLWQSADAVAAILRAAGIGDVYLVAQPWELRLSVAVFRAAGLAVTPAALPHADSHAFDLTALAIDTPAWMYSALALRQWAGLVCQAISPCAAWMRGPSTPGPS